MQNGKDMQIMVCLLTYGTAHSITQSQNGLQQTCRAVPIKHANLAD